MEHYCGAKRHWPGKQLVRNCSVAHQRDDRCGVTKRPLRTIDQVTFSILFPPQELTSSGINIEKHGSLGRLHYVTARATAMRATPSASSSHNSTFVERRLTPRS